MKPLKLAATLALVCAIAAQSAEPLKVRITWGEQSQALSQYFMKPIAATPGLKIESATPIGLEPGEGLRDGAWRTQAGGGDVDGVEMTLSGAGQSTDTIQNVHVIWADLIAAADSDTARRLAHDAAMKPGSPRLTVQMNAEGTRGFTVTADQLRTEKAMWIPSLDVFITAGDDPVSFEQHRAQLSALKGQRILDQVHSGPEATYSQYTSLWQDMGSPDYIHPNQPAPGHIVCLTWDSAIPKFGIDRGGGVRNDYGNPDHFQFWFDFGDLMKGIARTWKGQRLEDGLPVITTTFEQDGARYEVEQFAYPLDGPTHERRGDINMVLLERLRVTDLTGRERVVPITFSHRRQFPSHIASRIIVDREGDTVLFRESAYHRVLLGVSGVGEEFDWNGTADYQQEMKRVNGTLFASLRPNASREFVIKIPSPLVRTEDETKFQALDYTRARQDTLKFWADYVNRGARFRVPEKDVNDMFNSTLWHALRLPRRHGGSDADVAIDLPYSNFAYSQTGTPWPVNQSVYVDYMLYDLRGYHAISTEELLTQYRNNQEYSGHVNGFANWLVYTPGMLYSVAQNYLLSGDREAFERLLPSSLKALDWCLEQVRAAQMHPGDMRGLVTGPLNDGTGEGVWAFNQAYMYAGLDLFGRALERAGLPRAAEARDAAREVYDAIQRGFGGAAMRSPLVQLRDHTWQPYVPCEAATYRRILDEWYPTDVDTGAVHLIRLQAVPPRGDLADWLLNDHEDNLFYKGWGIANEPVYNQQATAYLLRDDVNATIRTFYSYMASGFSHSVYEPVEHRWTHGQYFGPPSTDGAWFELYRNMLIHEQADGALVLGLATPRAWLEPGKKIEVERAPTWYGDLSMSIACETGAGRIDADIAMPARSHPRELLVRLRHPEGKPIRSVTVNGRTWKDFDPEKEYVRIPEPEAARYSIVASY